MAKTAIVSEELAKKFATEKDSPYTRFVRSEGLDIIGAHYVPNLHTVELKPWARRGGHGVFINHEASRTSNDCYVCEIPPVRGNMLAFRRSDRSYHGHLPAEDRRLSLQLNWMMDLASRDSELKRHRRSAMLKRINPFG